jgi:hypothetical protein
MATPSDEQRRALQLLARSPDGCTEALMMANGFPIEMPGDLATAGLALATPKDTRAAAPVARMVTPSGMPLTD